MPINSDNSLAILAIKALNEGGGGGDVTSVFGRTGTVIAQSGDYNVAQITGAAPLNSPAFTNNPTAPTQTTSDNSTKLATTEFVQNNLTPINAAIANLQIISPATIGAIGAQYPDLTTAYNAGIRYMECVSNFAQNQFLFSESVYIKIRNNITITFNNALSNPIRYNGTNEANLIISTEGNGAIFWAPTSGGGVNLISASTNSNYNVYINNLNFDCTGAVSSVYIIGSSTNAKELYIEGNIKIKCKDNGASGIQFISTTARNIQALNANLIFIGGGANSRGVLSINNVSLSFINSIQLIGAFSTTDNLIDFQNSAPYIDSIVFNPTTPDPCQISLCGTINNILNVKNSPINLIISGDNAVIANSNLSTGILNINAKQNFKGLHIISSNTPINQTDSTVFTACKFGVQRSNSIGSITENFNPNFAVVNSTTGNDILNNGTAGSPFQTIAYADSVVSNNNSVIFAFGEFTEDITISTGINRTLRGQSVPLESFTKINGQIAISGTASGIFLSDLTLENNVLTPITVDSIGGLQGFYNITIKSTLGTIINIDYSAATTIESISLQGTSFEGVSGIINLVDITGGGSGVLNLYNCIKPNIFIGANWTVNLYNTAVGTITGNNSAIINKQGMNLAQSAVLDNFASFDSQGQVKDSNIPSSILVKTTNTTALYSNGANGVSQIFFDYTDGLEYSTWQSSDIQGAFLDPRYNIDQNAYLGIGGTFSLVNKPSSKLDVDGDVEIKDTSAYYIGDPNTDGSWRWRIQGTDLVYERRESGIWVIKTTILA